MGRACSVQDFDWLGLEINSQYIKMQDLRLHPNHCSIKGKNKMQMKFLTLQLEQP